MKLINYLIFTLITVVSSWSFSQEYIAPMLYNPNLYQGQNEFAKITPHSFDSTFIFTTDTLIPSTMIDTS